MTPVSSPSESAPLAGVRVIDWTHVLSGPFVGYQLALLGADVLRIERADADDMVRVTGADPALCALGLSEGFISLGSGKRSVALDARDPDGRAAIMQLLATADVLVENFRPGKLAKLGFDPAQLIQHHPSLVVCSISGQGPDSPRRAYDHVVQAGSGLMVANRNAQGVPQRIGLPIVDYATGQQAALAILAALLRRASAAAAGRPRTRGEWLQVSMQGAALSLMAPAYAEALVSGTERPRSASTAFSGSPLSGTFQVEDGWLAIVCNTLEQGHGLLAALQAAGVDGSTCAALYQAVQANDVTACQQGLQACLRQGCAAEWDSRLAAHGVPVAVVVSPIEAARRASASWPRVTLSAPASFEGREVTVPGLGFGSSLALGPQRLTPPPRRGEHTQAVLAELGWPTERIDAALARGAAAVPAAAPAAH